MKKTHKAHLKAEKGKAVAEGHDVNYTRYETSPGVWRHDIYYNGHMVAREVGCREAFFILKNRDFTTLSLPTEACGSCKNLLSEKERLLESLDDSRYAYDLLHSRLVDAETENEAIIYRLGEAVGLAPEDITSEVVDEVVARLKVACTLQVPEADKAVTSQQVKKVATEWHKNAIGATCYDLTVFWCRRMLKAAEMREIALSPAEMSMARDFVDLRTINGTGFLARIAKGEADNLARIIAYTNWLFVEGIIPE